MVVKRATESQPVSFYRYSVIRRVIGALVASIAWFFVGLLFYNEAWAGVAVSIAGAVTTLRNDKQFVQARKRLLSIQFEQALQSISSSLHAGKSMENAMRTAAADLRLMYSQHLPYFAVELERINRMVEHGIPLEQALDDLARRLNIPDVSDWVDVFRTCKRTGGDLLAVMRHTSRAISEKMDLERELAVLIAGKRFEANVLTVVPFLLLAALRFGSPDYMAPLYSGMGRIIMTGALAALVASFYLARRLMRFEW
ncbi:type II secretion system F family protein [Paenibacillus alkalitolerans]|uniref:type II secretion system F family protein n=1 Tax=Paenibacillus alkalitolerans TaxID=2799335 RepID=UPI0018F598A3|nr:type II secretion system F family protein [Paenibacillus alkalitolerans]